MVRYDLATELFEMDICVVWIFLCGRAACPV